MNKSMGHSCVGCSSSAAVRKQALFVFACHSVVRIHAVPIQYVRGQHQLSIYFLSMILCYTNK